MANYETSFAPGSQVRFGSLDFIATGEGIALIPLPVQPASDAGSSNGSHHLSRECFMVDMHSAGDDDNDDGEEHTPPPNTAAPAKGPAGALIELGDTAAGKVLLWIIAIGLFAYGIFCIAEAKYRRAV